MVKKKAHVIEGKFGPLIEAVKSYVLLRRDFDWSFIPEKNRGGVEVALGKMRTCVKALFELDAVFSNLRLTLSMAESYPRRKGHPIPRSDHLGFVWFQHMNLCYMFREKYKLSANRANEPQAISQRLFREDISAGLKRIDKGIGPFIRDRGQHIHEWNVENIHIKMFSLVDFLHKHGKEPEQHDPRGHYQDAKFFLGVDIRKSISFVEAFLVEAMDGMYRSS
jgi:hypothetical protein